MSSFRTVVIAAVVLVLATTGGLAAYQVSDYARAEAAQQTVERTDELAVNTDVRQKLVADDDHDPTAYGENGTETVVYNGTEWDPEGNYTYYAETGEIEFLRDEPDSANVTYQYDVPKNQVADDQLQTLTVGFGELIMLAVGLSFVVVLLFLGVFTAKKMGVGNRTTRGR